MLVFNWLTIAAFLLLCGTAIILSSWVWKSAIRQRRRLCWPRVVGKVLERRMRRDGTSVFLEYLVAYEYGGLDYQRTCSDWSPGGYTYQNEVDFLALMRKRLDTYPEGGPIPLMLNPDDPGHARDRRGITWPLMPLAILVTAVFIALVAMLTPVIFVWPVLPEATAPAPR